MKIFYLDAIDFDFCGARKGEVEAVDPPVLKVQACALIDFFTPRTEQNRAVVDHPTGFIAIEVGVEIMAIEPLMRLFGVANGMLSWTVMSIRPSFGNHSRKVVVIEF